MSTGILFALLALFCWGVGDFLIQRSTREFGDWVALFFITAFGFIVLFPFALRDFLAIHPADIAVHLLFATSIIMLGAALLNLETLRCGKITVIEPIWATEVLVTVLIGSFVLGEHLSFKQTILIILILFGILLVSITSISHFKNVHLEKGAWLAFFGMLGMGITDVLYGVSAREMPSFFL